MEGDKESCQKCRTCCKFEKKDRYFTPMFTKAEAEKIEKAHGPQELIKPYKGSANVFHVDAIKSKEEPGIYVCPYLDEKTQLCRIYEIRPIDCRIWPFMFMKTKQGKLELACWDRDSCCISENMPDEEFNALKEKILKQLEKEGMIEFVKKNHEFAWDYENYTFVVKEIM